MRLTFRSDNPSDFDIIGWHTGRVREVRMVFEGATGILRHLEILTPKREGGATVWWPESCCDTFEAPDWRIDEHGALVHAPPPRPTPMIPRRAVREPGRWQRLVPAFLELVNEHCARPTLHTVGQLKLLADTMLDDETGTSPTVVPTPKHAMSWQRAVDGLGPASWALAGEPTAEHYLEFMRFVWLVYHAYEARLMRVREKTPAPKQSLHALYERYPHRTQFASADDPRIPGACQWPNPQDEQRARANLAEDRRLARAEARAKKLAERKGGKA